MRRFIYLDTDTLNSYLAQIFDGLIQSQEMEKSAGKKKEKQNRSESEAIAEMKHSRRQRNF